MQIIRSQETDKKTFMFRLNASLSCFIVILLLQKAPWTITKSILKTVFHVNLYAVLRNANQKQHLK